MKCAGKRRVEQARFSSKIIALHTPKALDALIEKRVAYLADYQNEAYAARYGRLVAQVRTAEAELGSDDGQYPLTEAVAKNLHKLMAYKDEYEVARLYADPAFVEKLKGSFEGDWKIEVPSRAADVLEEGRARTSHQEAIRPVGFVRDARAWRR